MQTRVKLELLPIEDDGFHIIMPAEINGRQARLLIDTGASRTVFDMERIRYFLPDDHPFDKLDKMSAGLGTSSMESQTVFLEEFRLGDTILRDYLTVVLNFEHVNRSYLMLGHPEIDGVLGSDLLLQLQAVIDYRKREIRWKHAE